MAKSKAQKALAAGPTGVGAKARAAARKVQLTRNGPKATEQHHLNNQEFSGKHHAPASYGSAKKNAMGGSNGGRHSSELAAYTPRHAGAFDHWRDVIATIKNGGGPALGRHAKRSAFAV